MVKPIDRTTAARLGAEAVRIIEAGGYEAPGGGWVDVREQIARAVDLTEDYPPSRRVRSRPAGEHDTAIEVRNESTLNAARRLAEAGLSPVALNFASANHPGGGFLTGARAQEESLARGSALYACLEGQTMYEHHQARRDPMYTDWAIYSPAVPVFRDDEEALLEQPFACAFITAPAVNAKVVLERDPSRRDEVRAAMAERVERVLAIAAVHGHDAAVLGAWGCGVFGNDALEVAELFDANLRGTFAGAFRCVVFAILDWSNQGGFIGPFQRVFGG